MIVACWSAKGGVGTTVVATGLARCQAAASAAGALLVDLAGDLPGVLGGVDPPGPGLAAWLAAGSSAPPDALARLEVPVCEGLSLLPRGQGPLEHEERARVFACLLAADPRQVVVDCGVLDDRGGVASLVAGAATRSVLVTRACYLALRRARSVPLRPSEIVLVEEPGRSLTVGDVADALGAPVVAQVPYDPAIARAVDAGLLATRLPRPLVRALREVH
jgi:hypothetical protein